MDILDTDIKYLPGIGPKRADLLAKEIGVHTYRDMLYYFPFRWIDKSKVYPISEIVATQDLENEDSPSAAYVQIRGIITRMAALNLSFSVVLNGLQTSSSRVRNT